MKKLICILIPIVLQSCKNVKILNGTYCYKYNYNIFFNSCLKLNIDSTFNYETGGDMQSFTGSGFYRFKNKSFVELTYTKPVVRTLLKNEIKLKFENKIDHPKKIYYDTILRTIYDTTSGPSALIIKKGRYYFTDSTFRIIKFKTRIYTKKRKFFIGSYYRYRRSVLFHFSQ